MNRSSEDLKCNKLEACTSPGPDGMEVKCDGCADAITLMVSILRDSKKIAQLDLTKAFETSAH